MQIDIDDEKYNLEIVRKKTTKNLYIRVKDDLTIYVTCNSLTTDREVIKIINKNYKSVVRMISLVKKKNKYDDDFYYLGKKYDIVYTESVDLTFGVNKVFMRRDFDVVKWKRKMALTVFQEHLDKCYHNFSRDIPKPKMRLRKMTSRWGVCNIKTKVITLNTALIDKDLGCLDYVIYHELAHLVVANHSKKFWEVVEENCPDYKKWRKLTNMYGEE